jgi:hypothetical protein
MTDLSPAAQAVLDAYSNDPFASSGESIAAALRALTRTTLVEEGNIRGWVCKAITAEDLLDIADELDSK